MSAAKLAKTWSILSGGFFNQPGLKSEVRGDRLLLRREAAGEPVVICEVDRHTLTPRRYALLDDTGPTARPRGIGPGGTHRQTCGYTLSRPL